MAARTETFGEKKAKVRARDFVPTSIAAISCDNTSTRSVSLGKVFIFAIAARPFVVPDIEDCTCLRGWFGFHSRGVDLGTGRASFTADNLFGLFCSWIGVIVEIWG